MPSATTSIQNFTFSPLVTGGLYYFLTRGPEHYRRTVLDKLHKLLSPAVVARGITALKWLFALGLVRNIHSFLSDLALNGWRFRPQKQTQFDWPNEVAIVTGAAGGFGGLISKGLAAHGIKVIAVDIVDKLPGDLTGNPKIIYYRCDITDRQAVLDLRAVIARDHKHPSVLVNNAGVCWQHTVLGTSEPTLRRLFDVNVLAHYWTLQAFLPAMVASRKGHVVTMASLASFVTPPGFVTYCATKSAVLSLHEGIKAEVHRVENVPEVNFSVVHPGFAATQMIQSIRPALKDAGWTVIDPEIVSKAVVDQILAARSDHIFLGPGVPILATVRTWPHWLVGILNAISKPLKLASDGKEAQLS